MRAAARIISVCVGAAAMSALACGASGGDSPRTTTSAISGDAGGDAGGGAGGGDGGSSSACNNGTVPGVAVSVNAWHHLVVTTPTLQFTYNLNVAPPSSNATQGQWWLTDGSNNLLLGFASGSATVNGTTLESTDAKFVARTVCQNTTSDALGAGVSVAVTNSAASASGVPDLVQTFVFYPDETFFTAQVHAVATGTFNGSAALTSNRLDVIDLKSGTVNPNPVGGSTKDRAVLDVPFDNDAFVRFDARTLSGDYTFWGKSYEVTAVYEDESRHGLVVGSIDHDFWKTGIFYQDDAHAGPILDQLDVFAGATTADDPCDFQGPTYGKDGTHDWLVPGGGVLPHGFTSGASVASPRVFVGWYSDWRDGMERFGRANGQVHPPLTWSGGSNPALFGWLSWGAYGFNSSAMSNSNLTKVSNDLVTLMHKGFENNSTAYVVLDANYGGDTASYTSLVNTIHANGQKAGGYLTPFAFWGSDPATSQVAGPEGQSYTCSGHTCTYADIVLQDGHGHYIKEDGAYVLDVTNSVTRQLITDKVNNRIAEGVDLLKIDFLTMGTMEGAFADPTVHSGIQAYDRIMSLIDATLAPYPNIFLAESIAPLFPGGYAHSRRISCDLEGQLNSVMNPQKSTGTYWWPWASTEYGLNSLTFGWWLSPGVYRFNDGDEMVLNRWMDQTPKSGYYGTAGGGYWPYARRNQALITGGLFLDATDYTDATALANSESYLTNPGVNHLASLGKSFRPVSGKVGYVGTGAYAGEGRQECSSASSSQKWYEEGSEAQTAFYTPATATDPLYLAVFNYDDASSTTVSVGFADLGLSSSKTYTVKSITNGSTVVTASGSFSVKLAPGQPALYSVQ